MTRGQIVVYAMKSNRKNAKSNYKSLTTYCNKDGSKKENIRYDFTKSDIMDFCSFMCYAKSQGLSHFKIVVYQQDTCLCTINNYMDVVTIEQMINHLYGYMRLLNFKEWDFSLQDLHGDSNTKFYINKYYHPTNEDLTTEK